MSEADDLGALIGAGFSVSTTIEHHRIEMASPPDIDNLLRMTVIIWLGALLLLLGMLWNAAVGQPDAMSMMPLFLLSVGIGALLFVVRIVYRRRIAELLAPVEVTLRQEVLSTRSADIALVDVRRISLRRVRGRTAVRLSTPHGRHLIAAHTDHDAMSALSSFIQERAAQARRELHEQGGNPFQVASVPQALQELTDG